MSLEEIALQEQDESKPENEPTGASRLRKTMIDISASCVFYTPIMAPIEYFYAGKTGEEVAYSRLAGIGFAFLTARYTARFGDWWQKIHNYTTSSALKQFITDTSGTLLLHIPLYGTALYITSRSYSTGEAAMIASLPTVIATAWPYRRFLRHWREIWRKTHAPQKPVNK